MRQRRVNAFTLIELLVVISIIALLIAILLPTLASVRRIAMVTLCMANLQQYTLGMTTTVSDNNGEYLKLRNQWAGATAIMIGTDRNYLHNFIDQELNGNPDLLWCPLAEAEAPNFRPPDNPGHDPEFGFAFWFHSGFPGYFGGYARMAGLFRSPPTNHDYTHAGFENIDPTSEYALLRPGGARDMVVCDRITSEAGGWVSMHSDDHFDSNTRRDNNVAYSDGHVVTRNQRISRTVPTPHWDEFYIRELPHSTYWLW